MAGRLHDDEELVENFDINVTPFIDVMLVLLIIFMVAAPLATVDVAVDLPSSAASAGPRPERPLFLTLKSDKSISLGQDTVAPDALGAALDTASGNDKTQRVFLRGDRTVPYDALMLVMDRLRAAGYLHIGLVAAAQAP